MPPAAYYAPPPPRRPIGIAILAVLVVLFGVLTLLVGLLALLGAAVLGAVGLGPLGVFAALFGGLILLFGIIGIVAGLGLWRLRGWAWWLAFLVALLEVLLAVPTFPASSVTLAIWLLVLVYLIAVKKHFGPPRPVGM